jgi:FixJ family two-component response regulator
MHAEPTVFVVDDTPGMRASITRLLEASKLATESFASGEEFLAKADPLRPGCLVVDVRMKGMTGLELQRQLLAKGVRLPVIVVSGFADVPGVVQAMKAGAVDFLEKPFREEALLRAVRDALARDAARRQEEGRLASLTAREREVLDLLVAGENYKEIAARLDVSPKTVEGHRVNMLRKLGLASAVEAVKFVLEHRAG